MAQKVPVTGVVEAVNSRGFKLGGKWYDFARNFNGDRPNDGDSIAFDAYGPKENLVYRVANSGGGNGSNHSVSANANPGVAVAGSVNGLQPGQGLRGGDPRGTALIGACTLLQGSEGTVEQVAQNAIMVSKAFEIYLSGASDSSDDTEGMH